VRKRQLIEASDIRQLYRALGGDWPEGARNAAKSLSAGEDDQPKRVQLLSDMRDIFEVGGIDPIASVDLVQVRPRSRLWAID